MIKIKASSIQFQFSFFVRFTSLVFLLPITFLLAAQPDLMNVMTNGNVGIGITSPSAKLHLRGDHFPNSFMFLESDATKDTGFRLMEEGTTKWHIFNNGTSQKFNIRNMANYPSFIIDQTTGNVGINIESPSHKLHVVGNEAAGAVGHFVNTVSSSDQYGVYGACDHSETFGFGGRFEGGYTGAHGRVTPNLSGNHVYYGLLGEVVTEPAFEGNGDNYGVVGQAFDGNSNFGLYGDAKGDDASATNYGVYGVARGTGTNHAGFFQGNVTISGMLSKGGGSFKIDHPLDPSDKYLYHSFVESPDMMNMYNGNVVTNQEGEAIVELPEYFEPLNKQFKYQLTVIGKFAQAIISNEIHNNQFSIKTNKPNVKVSWQVTGIRQDAYANAHRIQVEEDKASHERGKYLHPEVFGKPREMSVNYRPEHEAEMKKLEEYNSLHNEQRGWRGKTK